MRDKPILIIALGGNALIKKGGSGSIEEQFDNLKLPMEQIARLSRDHRIIITHGNGPQVGDLLIKQELCDEGEKLPLEILVAQTEGQIGYMIESSLDTALMGIGVDYRPLVSMITYVVVRPDDPRLENPDKPIGPVLAAKGRPAPDVEYPVRETAKGWRRVVGSPQPMTIVERREIRTLIELDFIVICCGGGGIPVVREDRGFQGVDAVIDKDLASSLLGREVKADLFVIATDVEGAWLNYGKYNAHLLAEATLNEIEEYAANGHFPPGSMLPKVEACRRFTKATGKPSLICSIDAILEGVAGRTGTRITP